MIILYLKSKFYKKKGKNMDTFFLSHPWLPLSSTFVGGSIIAAIIPSADRPNTPVIFVTVMAINIIGNYYKARKEALAAQEPMKYSRLVRKIAKDTFISLIISICISRMAIWADLNRHPDVLAMNARLAGFQQERSTAAARYAQELIEAREKSLPVAAGEIYGRYLQALGEVDLREAQAKAQNSKEFWNHPVLREMVARMNYPFGGR